MIVPMKKVTLLALGSEENSALTALRRLGVMQVELAKGNESGNTQQLAEAFAPGCGGSSGRPRIAETDNLDRAYDFGLNIYKE